MHTKSNGCGFGGFSCGAFLVLFWLVGWCFLVGLVCCLFCLWGFFWGVVGFLIIFFFLLVFGFNFNVRTWFWLLY